MIVDGIDFGGRFGIDRLPKDFVRHPNPREEEVIVDVGDLVGGVFGASTAFPRTL